MLWIHNSIILIAHFNHTKIVAFFFYISVEEKNENIIYNTGKIFMTKREKFVKRCYNVELNGKDFSNLKHLRIHS